MSCTVFVKMQMHLSLPSPVQFILPPYTAVPGLPGLSCTRLGPLKDALPTELQRRVTMLLCKCTLKITTCIERRTWTVVWIKFQENLINKRMNHLGGGITQWIVFSLHTQGPRVWFLAFLKWKNCQCCQVKQQRCCLEQWTAEAQLRSSNPSNTG